MTAPRSLWGVAIGNLAQTPVAAPALAPKTTNQKARGTRTVTKTFCPYCGHRVRSPDGPKPWTPEDDEILRNRVSQGTKLDSIASELGRALSSIRSRIATLKLKPEAT